jgi:hypothetical protein
VVRTLGKNAWERDTQDLLSAQAEGREKSKDVRQNEGTVLIRDTDDDDDDDGGEHVN